MPTAAAPVCTHCGAPLEVDASARRVTCGHCGSHLEVKRTASAAWTELADRTDRIERTVDRLDRRAELAELDREWERTRRSLMVRGRGGAETEPSALGGVLAGAIGLGGAAFTALVTANSPFPGVMKWGVPLAFAAVGAFSAWNVLTKAAKWRRAEADYRRRRAELAAGEEPAADDGTAARDDP